MMFNTLTDLVQHLQDVHAHHPDDAGRIIVALPTAPHARERFAVGAIHRDGPSVVLHCRPLEDELATPPPSEPPAPVIMTRSRLQDDRPAKARAYVHNDYEDLL